jgi:flagellar hook-associated protein 3 FlgL
MTSSFTRLGTANTYDSSVRNISARQSALSALQENLTSGKRVVRASDDPTSAANAERALNRISRIATDQRALDSQRNAITVAESTLGDVNDALQRFRELVVNAGNGVHTSSERKTISIELQGLRDQIFSLANQKDTNGLPLFSALGSALTPFVGPQATAPDYTFNGLPGQTASSDVTIPFTLDGDGAFMHQPARDGVYNTIVSTIPTSRSLTTDNVVVTNPALVTGASYQIAITGVDTTTTPGTTVVSYNLTTTPPGSTAAQTAPGYPSTQQASISVVGMGGLALTLNGSPAVGDTVTVDPSPSIFSVLDDAIKDISGAPNNNGAAQAVGQALHNIDIGMGRVAAVRGQAGDLLNRADRISANQDKRSIQLESDRSRAEDLDMVKGISDFNNQQTGYQAALQTYAQVQKLSLFNYIG